MKTDEVVSAITEAADRARIAYAVRAVTLASVALVVPIRVWSLVAAPSIPVYAMFPAWLQVLVIVAFGVQGAAAWRGRLSPRLTALALAASLATAAVQGGAAFGLGSFIFWGCMAGVQAWAYASLIDGGR